MRSFSGMKAESALSSVVLPAPVPPEIRTFRRAVHDHLQHVGDVFGQRFVLDQRSHPQRIGAKTANRKHWSID